MAHAFFSFAEVRAARVGVERLRQCGVPAADVGLHLQQAEGAPDALGALLYRVYDPRTAPGQARAHADDLAGGGAVVSVRIADDGQRPQIERLMEAAGSTRRSAWLASRVP